MKKTQKQPNTTIIKAEKIDFTKHYSAKTIYDYRLTDSEAINLLRILGLTNFYISERITADFLHISVDKLKRIIKGLKAKGYLNIIKEGNKYTYQFKQESNYCVNFKPSLIEYYTAEQLNALLNNAETPQKYKNLIKKYFNALILSENELKATIKEIKDFEKPKSQEQQEQEQQNENDLLEYFGIKQD